MKLRNFGTTVAPFLSIAALAASIAFVVISVVDNFAPVDRVDVTVIETRNHFEEVSGSKYTGPRKVERFAVTAVTTNGRVFTINDEGLLDAVDEVPSYGTAEVSRLTGSAGGLTVNGVRAEDAGAVEKFAVLGLGAGLLLFVGLFTRYAFQEAFLFPSPIRKVALVALALCAVALVWFVMTGASDFDDDRNDVENIQVSNPVSDLRPGEVGPYQVRVSDVDGDAANDMVLVDLEVTNNSTLLHPEFLRVAFYDGSDQIGDAALCPTAGLGPEEKLAADQTAMVTCEIAAPGVDHNDADLLVFYRYDTLRAFSIEAPRWHADS